MAEKKETTANTKVDRSAMALNHANGKLAVLNAKQGRKYQQAARRVAMHLMAAQNEGVSK